MMQALWQHCWSTSGRLQRVCKSVTQCCVFAGFTALLWNCDKHKKLCIYALFLSTVYSGLRVEDFWLRHVAVE
jgi:hypothetical protein